MALETSLRRFTLLPGFIHTAAVRRASLVQTGNGEPRKAHWLGNQESPTPQQDQKPAGQGGRPPQRPDPRGVRDLATITLGEVEEAYQHFSSQLVPAPLEGWVAKNYFCQLSLKGRGTARPPVVFGRVRTVYPSSGHINNVEMMEMYFPRPDAPPDVLQVHDHDISLQKPSQSYCVGVKFYLSQEELSDFSQSENIFIEKGFAPLYETSSVELLDLNEQNHSELPWLYVIGSGWFASIPESVQPEIRGQLRNLVHWGKAIFNYHPRRYALEYRSLNEELDFQYGFTEHYLVAPQNTGQALQKVEESFGAIFMQGM